MVSMITQLSSRRRSSRKMLEQEVLDKTDTAPDYGCVELGPVSVESIVAKLKITLRGRKRRADQRSTFLQCGEDVGQVRADEDTRKGRTHLPDYIFVGSSGEYV